MQLILTTTDAIELFFFLYSPGTIYTLSMLFIQRDFSMSGTKIGVGKGEGGGRQRIHKFIYLNFHFFDKIKPPRPLMVAK
jgi:hypothetical protein